ncbi:MAG TPA: hypothetical protein VLA97_14360, partial [Nocardioidaceae bacterium]|nr:hypothetical protein [Nocardioidaceae bacterium]
MGAAAAKAPVTGVPLMLDKATGTWPGAALSMVLLADGSPTTSGDVLLWVLLVASGVACLGMLTWAGLLTMRRRRRIAQVRARALTARDAMVAGFLALEGAKEATGARVTALPEAEDVTLAEIRTRFAETDERIAVVMTTYLDLSAKYGARRVARLGVDQASSAAQAMGTVAETMQRLTEDVAKVEVLLDALESLRASLPERIARVRSAVADVGRLLPERAGQGFFVDAYGAVLPRIQQRCVEAEELLGQMRVGDAGVAADTASAIADELQEAVAGLPELQESLRGDLELLRARHRHCGLLLRGAGGLLDRLEGTFHASCTDDVRALVAEAAGRLAALPGVLDRLDRASSMEVQDFDDAQDLVDRAKAQVSQIENDCSAVVVRRDQLGMLAS